jgi:hypothetical protein
LSFSALVWVLPFMEQGNLSNAIQALATATGGSPQATATAAATPVKTFVCPSDPSNNTQQPGYTSYAPNALVFGNGTVTSVSPLTAQASSISGGARFPASLPDGTSNTILNIEMLAVCGSAGANTYWMYTDGNTWYNSTFSTAKGATNTLTQYPPFVASYGLPSGGSAPMPSLDPAPGLGTTPGGLTGAAFQAGLNTNTCANFIGEATSGHTAATILGMGDGSVRNLSQGVSQTTYQLALIPNDGMPMPSDW